MSMFYTTQNLQTHSTLMLMPNYDKLISGFNKMILPVIIASATLIANQPVLAAQSAGEYRLLGLKYRQLRRYDEAIKIMQKSVELEPENISGRVNLGWTLHLAGKEEEAAQSLWKAI